MCLAQRGNEPRTRYPAQERNEGTCKSDDVGKSGHGSGIRLAAAGQMLKEDIAKENE